MLLNKNDYYIVKADDNYQILNKNTGEVFEVNDDGYEYIKLAFRSASLNDISKFTSIDSDECASFIELLNNYKSEEFEDNVFHLQWHITGICNLRCKHCYQEEYVPDFNLYYDNLLKIADNYFDYIRIKGFRPTISITGGEPLLYDKLFDLLRYLRQKDDKFDLFILTNGTLITDEIAHKLKMLNITAVQISFDGYNRETHDYIRGNGSFDSSVKGFEKLKNRDIFATIHTVLMNPNVNHIKDMIHLAKKLSANMITFSRFIPFGNGVDNIEVLQPHELKNAYQEIFEYNKRNEIDINLNRDLFCIFDENCGSYCPAGTKTVTILNNGDVLPCRRLPIVVGNAIEDPMSVILFSSKSVRKLSFPVKECLDCSVKDNCKGGCSGLTFAYHKDIGVHADPQCWLVNEKLPVMVDSKEIDYDFREGTYKFLDERIANEA